MDAIKSTPLRGEYDKYGAKIVDFAGYYLPMQFKGILEEHKAVREKAGLFDVSHMGEITIKGRDAEAFVDYLLTNDIKSLNENDVVYTFMCNYKGGVVDDLLVYKYSKEYYYLVVNASNKDKDFKWMVSNKGNFDVDIKDISETVAQLAIQGPHAEKIVQKLTNTDLSEIKFFKFKDNVDIKGKKVLISRTGYTGEDGFEIYLKPEDAAYIWQQLLETGKEFGIEPVGLGARDTLRFEATLPLYGNEMDEDVSPLEMTFGFFVKLDKGDFIGRDILIKQKAEGVSRKLVGFELVEKNIPRHGYLVVKDGVEIGHVTTGYKSPTLGKTIGLALIDAKYASIGTEFNIKIRNKEYKAVVINKRFYQKKTKSK